MFYPDNLHFPLFLFNIFKKILFCTAALTPSTTTDSFTIRQKTDLQGLAAYVGAIKQDTVKITIRPLHILFIVTSEYLFLTDKFQHSHYSTIFLVADIQ